jgi:hypothetical protein
MWHSYGVSVVGQDERSGLRTQSLDEVAAMCFKVERMPIVSERELGARRPYIIVFALDVNNIGLSLYADDWTRKGMTNLLGRGDVLLRPMSFLAIDGPGKDEASVRVRSQLIVLP